LTFGQNIESVTPDANLSTGGRSMPTKVSVSAFTVSDDAVSITGPSAATVRNGLVQNHTVTISEMAAVFGQLNPKDITIGDDGSVTINNANVARQVVALQSGGADMMVDYNCICA
jgi:hypothetical protein